MKKIVQNLPLIVLAGRTNVGKSTIFNRFTENQKALVSNIPGTTRDEREGLCVWQNHNIMIADTAGLDINEEEEIDQISVKKARIAMKKSAIILFIVDSRDGVLPQDKELAQEMKKLKKPVLLVVNKVDSQKFMANLPEFYKLGLGEPYAISAKTGSGTGDLLDKVVKILQEKGLSTKAELVAEGEKIRIGIIGKPNAGKSSLLNKFVGEDRAIVSSVPHTTRDSQDTTIEYTDEKTDKKYELTFIDTAGIIKHRRINTKMQALSIEQSLKSIERSDIVLLVIDAGEPISMQDKNISREILERGKSLIFVVNKWDLIPDKDTHSDKEYIKFLYNHFAYLTWAPVVFVSAKTGFKVDRLIDVILEINNNQNKQFSQGEMDYWLKFLLRKQAPADTYNEKPPFLYKLNHVGNRPLTFEVIAARSKNVHFSYRRYIINTLRDKLKLMGCGIKIKLTERER